MSCKGNDLVRRLLYTAAQCAAKWNPPVKALFVRLMAEGKDYNVAIGHCMAKLLRQVFALWKKDCDFDAQFETRSSADSAPNFIATSEETGSDQAEEHKEVAGHNTAIESPRTVITATPSTQSKASRSNLRPLNFSELRKQVTITQVLQHIGWRPQSMAGAEWRGTCPLHEGDASRCFAVQAEKNMYCCHRCGSQGNALDLWTALCGKPLLEAAWELVETLGLAPPLIKEGPPERNCSSATQAAPHVGTRNPAFLHPT